MSDSATAPGATCTRCSRVKASGLDRRAFLSTAALTAVAAVLEACGGITGPSFFTGPSGGPLTVKLSSFPALATVGGLARVDNGNGAPTALVRTGSASFVGVTMVCTHQGGTLEVTGAGFTCPNHGAQFSETGSWRGGQPASNLSTYPTSFDGNNTVTIARP